MLPNIVSGLLSIGPRLRRRGDTLVITTRLRAALLTLGLTLKRVTVDIVAETITIETRRGWFFAATRTIPFREVVAVTYGYADHSTSQYFSQAHDSLDVYRVGLRLLGDREVHLFRFIGDGTWVNNSDFPDWMHWEDRGLDCSGTQDRDSLALVELLSGLLGVRVRPPK
jgi:hypothetical protein